MHTVHDALFAFKAFLGQDITGQGYCSGLAVPVRFLEALCALKIIELYNEHYAEVTNEKKQEAFKILSDKIGVF